MSKNKKPRKKKTSPSVAKPAAKSPDNNSKKIAQFNSQIVQFYQQGNIEAALTLCQQALTSFPNELILLKNAGAFAAMQNKPILSEKYTLKALAINPDDATTHYNLATLLKNKKQFAEAEKHYQIALKLKPDYAEAHYNLAILLQQEKQFPKAEKHYQTALKLKPDYAKAHNNLAALLQETKQFTEAEKHYQIALKLKPDYAEAHNNLALLLQETKQFTEAEKHYQIALKLKPDYAEAHNNLAILLKETKQFAEAEKHYQIALKLKPDYAEAHNNLANLLKETKQLTEAEKHYQIALKLKPDYATTHNNLANLLQETKQFTEAEKHYQTALKLKPDYAEAQFNRSLLLLIQGDFQQGWQGYEFRYHPDNKKRKTIPPKISIPQYQGESLRHKTILIYAEQGLGDELQFIRYLPLLKTQKGVKEIMLVCKPPLKRLFSSMTCIDHLLNTEEFTRIENLQGLDYWVFIMSLPLHFNTTLATIPKQIPYLFSPQQNQDKWKHKLPQGFNIGLVWQGNPDHKADEGRSLPLRAFQPLTKVAGINFISLQKHHGLEQIAELSDILEITTFDDMDKATGAFIDTAAIIMNLDLIITVDSAVAHLAGALGRSVWVLLKYVPDWRWMLDREDSPWYPSIRLFRQTTDGDWDSVMQDVVEALQERIYPMSKNKKPRKKKTSPSVAKPAAKSPDNNSKKIAQFNSQIVQFYQQGNIEAALTLCQQALTSFPNELILLKNAGAFAAMQNKPILSEKYTLKALAINPDDATTHYNLATLLKNKKQFAEAEKHYQIALKLKPDYAEAHYNLAILLQQEKQFPKAEKHYQTALKLKPDYAKAHNNLAALLQETKQFTEAEKHYQIALKLKPDYAEAHNNLALLLQETKQFTEAEKHYQIALKLKPDYAEAHNNLAILLKETKQFAEAEKHYQIALKLKPDYAEAHNNLANLLKETKQLTEAEKHYQIALKLKPDYATTHNNLANLLQETKQFTEAEKHYQTALKLKPDYAEAQFNRSLLLLIQGDFQQGWQGYEFRYHPDNKKRKTIPPKISIPQYQGESLRHKTILIYAEQGLGDELQFIRYLPLLKTQKGVKEIMLVCKPPLKRLFSSMTCIDHLLNTEEFTRIENLQGLDYWVFIMSLPLHFNTTLATIPKQIPYLFSPQQNQDKWKHKLPQGFNIGLVWQGNPDHKADEGRSLPLRAFQPLTKVAGINFISLQKHHGLEQIAELSDILEITTFDDMDKATGAFIDTAAIIMNLDLIITVDSAVAHLAGALGRSVWVLLKYVPDWRWMLDREDSPWYPSIRLFRQTTDGDWDSVMQDVVEALQERIYPMSKNKKPRKKKTSPSVAKPAAKSPDNNSKKIAQFNSQIVQFYQQGNIEAALTLCQQALTSFPNELILLKNAGAFAAMQNKPILSEKYTLKALAINPDDATTHYNLATLLKNKKQFAEAEKHYQIALKLKPDYAEAHYNLAILLQQEKQFPKAEKHYQTALKLKPDYAKAHNNLAALLQETKQFTEAEKHYQIALKLKPDYAEAHNNLALLLQETKQFTEAEKHYQIALKLKPDYAEAHNNLAILLKETKQFAEAEKHYQIALKLKPDYAEAHNNLANLLKETKQLTEAEKHYQIALKLKPDYATTHNNLANLLQETKQFTEAEKHYQTALKLKPDYAEAQFNRSLLLLIQGDFQQGWQGYEFRYHPDNKKRKTIPPKISIPQYQGESLRHKTILIYAEQGLGDELQFIRYLPLLKTQKGVKEIMLVCKPPLKRLFSSMTCIDHLLNTEEFTRIENLQGLDYWVFIMSLPLHFNTTLATIPKQIPYLFSPQQNQDKWKHKLPQGFNIGLVWQGNPDHKADEGRSLPLRAFQPLTKVAGINFISLQKHHGLEQIAELSDILEITTFDDMDKATGAFIDTPAIIMNLDLIITVDTAVAHLAGALGRSVWVLLKYVPDWRWMLDREDSPWYPSIRLFRQTTDGDWDSVMQDVVEALQERIYPMSKNKKPRKKKTSPSVAKSAAKSPDNNSKKIAQFNSQIVQFYQQGNIEAALTLCQQALTSFPNELILLKNAGAFAAMQNKPILSEKYTLKALAINSDDATTHYNLATLLKRVMTT